MEVTGTRRYRILGVLGVGGFGTVYRARMEDDHGFSKDVAVKMMSDDDPPEWVLKRLRDEARILGLLRDRALVSVDPPVVLGGKWSVVMEYVEGVDAGHVLRTIGAMPPGVAAAVVAEVARVLHRGWHFEGPDGKPLRVMHRDLKPSNIQITPSGDVKVLDYGIARAEFEGREARTTHQIMGTKGFIAPERMFGDDTATSDVWSLGVLLHLLVTGEMPGPGAPSTEDEDEALASVLALSEEMRAVNPEKRPSAREVERRAAELAARNPPSLRDWAEAHLPSSPSWDEDTRVGRIFTQSTERVERHVASWRPLAVGVATGLGLLAVVGAVVLGTGWPGAASVAPRGGEVSVVEPPAPNAASVEVAEPVAPEEEPRGPSVEELEAPSVEAALASSVATAPAPSVEAAVAPSVEAAVAPADEAPHVPVVAPPSPAPAFGVRLSSIPLGAEVIVDGRAVGRTPVLDLELPAGAHEVQMRLGDASSRQRVEVGRRHPVLHIWTVEEDAWEAGY